MHLFRQGTHILSRCHSSDHNVHPVRYSPIDIVNIHNMNLECNAPTSTMHICSHKPCNSIRSTPLNWTPNMEHWKQTTHNTDVVVYMYSCFPCLSYTCPRQEYQSQTPSIYRYLATKNLILILMHGTPTTRYNIMKRLRNKSINHMDSE